jgi:hypothetical protein
MPNPSTDTGPELVSMAQQFTGLPMSDLIGGPLMASAKANNLMAISQTQMILEMGFNKTEKDNQITYTPIMLDLTLTRSALSEDPGATPNVVVTPVVTNIQVPMLTILPINSLGVQTVDVTFDMEVQSSYSHNTSDTQQSANSAEASLDAKFGGGLWSVDIHGKVSHSDEHKTTDESAYRKSNNARYHVAVHAGQLPLPDGIKIIIQAYANAITPIEMPTKAASRSTPA